MIQLLPVPADRSLVIFTDLDGTMIDHHSYETEGSRNALNALAKLLVPLVFCSSKTFAEQVHLQRRFGIFQPFIFENGSGAAIPHGFFPEKMYPSKHREDGYDMVEFAHAGAGVLRSVLAQIPGIKGYANASDDEISAATGLAGEAIGRARERRFTETLLSLPDGADAARVGNLLKPAGFILSRGGRFYTVQSASVSKGRAAQWMMDIFRRTTLPSPFFAAMGDSPNDVPMLQVADQPFLVQSPDQSWAEMEIPGLIRINAVGPAGFSEAVRMLLGE